MDIKEQVTHYVAENFLFNSYGFHLGDDDSFLEHRIVDSLGVIELVTFVEEAFRITVFEDEIVPDNFDSVSKIVAYVGRKRG